MRRALTFVIAGLFAQIVDGALGMAYGVTATSTLLSMGAGVAAASATVHLSEIGTTLVSGVSHWKLGNVNFRLVLLLGIPGAIGAALGATVLSGVDGTTMRPWVAAVLLGLGIYVIGRFATHSPGRRSTTPPRGRFLVPLGLVGGFLDAVGGGGWGPVTTPTLLTFGHQEPRTALGSVSASEFAVSVAASVAFLANLGTAGIDPVAVIALLAGGVIAAPLAAYLARRLPAQVSGTLVGVLLVILNVRTLMLGASIPGTARLWVLCTIAAVGFGLVGRTARRHLNPANAHQEAPVTPSLAGHPDDHSHTPGSANNPLIAAGN